MIKQILLILNLLLFSHLVFGQKHQLDHTVYNDWKSLKTEQISDFGKYTVYEINPHRGDGYLY